MTAPGLAPTPAAFVPIVRSFSDGVLVALAFLAIALVGLWFSTDVNRVFDVPKALALKGIGGLLFAVWLIVGVTGKGWPIRSLRLFLAPVLAVVVAVGLSTIFSIDPVTSLVGVYERQFGFEGQLACAGIFVTLASGLRSKRGAVLALLVILLVGGTVGAYAGLQSQGLDPFGFFKRPFNKVYGTLGNATFAGNALALIFPVCSMAAILAVVLAFAPARREATKLSASGAAELYAIGFGAMALLQLGGGAFAAGQGKTGEALYVMALVISFVFFLGVLAMGSFGPDFFRSDPQSAPRIDAIAAGAIGFMALGILVGLYATRTRGAWVGTAAALAGGLLLLPKLFRDEAELLGKMRTVGVAGLIGGVVLVAGFVKLLPDHVVSVTIKSIPAAFDPNIKIYGQGQGTRRYLWVESPRVLLENEKTLERRRSDARDMRERLGDHSPDIVGTGSWRDLAVFPFGIGIETYRYAFMSHKSRELESLDPMTNHDNPHNNYLYVLASCGILGLAAYLWLLYSLVSTAWRRFDTDGDRLERALAFGVVTSFFSYSVYSIAGFDSVACSVFFYALLAVAAVFFEPAEGEASKPLHEGVSEGWFRGRPVSYGGMLFAAVLGVIIAGRTAYDGIKVWRAETAFVGKTSPRTFEEKVANIERAIKINPAESYYWMSLGGAFTDMGKAYQRRAMELSSQGDTDGARVAGTKAEEGLVKSERALYQSLEHAWAPENIFISLFTTYYAWNRMDDAERALERALEHSPHLPPVRANLAVLKLDRGAFDGAIADADWVLDVDPNNSTALRTRGRAKQKLGDFAGAELDLAKAVSLNSSDRQTREWLNETKAARTASTP